MLQELVAAPGESTGAELHEAYLAALREHLPAADRESVPADGAALDTPLREVRLQDFSALPETTPLSTAISRMKRTHNYKLLVVDDRGSPSGLITEIDIIDRLAKEEASV